MSGPLLLMRKIVYFVLMGIWIKIVKNELINVAEIWYHPLGADYSSFTSLIVVSCTRDGVSSVGAALLPMRGASAWSGAVAGLGVAV